MKPGVVTTGVRKGGRILFLDKVFLTPAERPPCGVEVFNLNLLRDLLTLGYSVTAVTHPSWHPGIRQWLGALPVELVASPAGLSELAGGVAAAWKARRPAYDTLLLGNVGNRLIPTLAVVRWLRIASRAVLIAHREPSARFVSAVERLPTAVLAVNAKIASHFQGGRFVRVEVGYGITGEAQFFPRPEPRSPSPDTVEFCVVGHLDRKWKGADTAVAAFRAMRDEVRRHCRLHLAAFDNPPSFPEKNIVAYAWFPFDRMGEFLRGMDVMLVPSRDEDVMRETFSQAAVQGMLCGLPLIVSDLPILREKVEDGAGLVFRDVAELASKMTDLARDPDRRRNMGRRGREIASAKYIWNTQTFADRFLFPPV